MKKTFKFVMLFLSLLLVPVFYSCDDDDDNDFREEVISYEKLPSAAKSFVSEFYSGVDVKRVEKDYDHGVVLFEVKLSNGHEITFNSSGEWVEVDAPDRQSIPSGIAPLPIESYLNDNYQDYGINDITKTGYGYEVELTTGVDLRFDANGNFLGIDR